MRLLVYFCCSCFRFDLKLKVLVFEKDGELGPTGEKLLY